MESQMTLSGELLEARFEARFDKLKGKILSLKTDSGEVPVLDRGVSVVYDGQLYQTLDREPADIQWHNDSFVKSYVFTNFDMSVVTSVSPDRRTIQRRISILPHTRGAFALESRTFFDLEFQCADLEVVRHALWSSSLTALFLRSKAGSWFAMFDHPFGIAQTEGSRIRLSENTYQKMDGNAPYDEGTLFFGPTQLTGKMVSQEPIEELDYAHNNSWQPWVWSKVGKSWWCRGEADLDAGEITAARRLVKSIIPWKKGGPVSVHVPWCENDFEIDISTAEGQVAYARMFDLLADIGCKYTLFTPGGGPFPKRPDGGWQHVMWLGLGGMVGEREWTKDTPLPAHTQRLIDLANEKGIGVLAYVNPAYKFGADKGYWLRMGKDGERKDECCYACAEFREWLTQTLIDFKDAYGLAGYCLDFIGEHHPCYDPDHDHVPGEDTHLAGWRAFQSITRALNEADPDIVIDGRLCTFRFAPASAAGITYPHPFLCDEQPNHMTSWPDLSVDRVFANFQRRVAYWGRNRFFLPNYKIPGFMTHQQSRTFRWKHSWDRDGWNYSVLSSIAASGINNVINYLPIREEDEYQSFGSEDRQWLAKWLQWAERNSDLLLNARDLFDEPCPEKVDGIAACAGDKGVLFLINPNYRAKNVEVVVGQEIGLQGADEYAVTELNPNDGAVLGCAKAGEKIAITVPPHQVLVLSLAAGSAKPYQGRAQDWLDAEVGPWTLEDGSGVDFPYEFKQAPGWQVDEVDTNTKPTHWVNFKCTWNPDPAIAEKLSTQVTPIQLEEHERVQPYLDPGRLLMSFMFRFPENMVQAILKVNGETVPVETCYLGSSWRVVETEYCQRNISGLFADLDGRIEFGKANEIKLELAHYGRCEWVGAFVEHL